MQQVNHCIAVSSATAALHIAYLALGVGGGDAVFVPSFAWPSAANMALLVGARPVLVDVRSDTYNIDSRDLQARIEECLARGWGTPHVVVPVHEFGLAADMKALSEVASEYNLTVVEDAACALGARYDDRPVGSFGVMSVFSFHPRKAITTGEGGIIATNDDKLAEKCRMWRNHGQTTHGGQRRFLLPGLNYRMTEIQAAIGRVQLGKFAEVLQKRRIIAQQYISELVDMPRMTLPSEDPAHTWQTFMICLEDDLDREKVIEEFARRGITVASGAVSAHCLQLYQERLGYVDDALPTSLQLHKQGLALPVHAQMTMGDVDKVCAILREVLWGLSEGYEQS